MNIMKKMFLPGKKKKPAPYSHYLNTISFMFRIFFVLFLHGPRIHIAKSLSYSIEMY